MKRTVVRTLVKIPVSVVIFCTGISLLLSGCERGACPFIAGTGPGCGATVSGPGIYLVTYQDSTGAQQIKEITVTGMSGEGTVCVTDCTTIIGDPVLIAPLPPDNLPPDCSHARASVPILPNDPARMVEETIEGVTDPDGNPIGIRIDAISEDEPEAGLFEGDACPDSFSTSVSTARLRAERSANGSGRVYTIGFTASDRTGGFCTGSAKVCIPVTEGGTCVDDGSVFSLCRDGLLVSDLSVTISDSPDPIAPGELLTYTIVVSTNGPSDASNILLTDTLPSGVTYVGAETGTATCSQSEGVVSCHITQLNPEGRETIEITVRSTTSGIYTNTVSVGALEPDPNIDNNTATATTVASTSAVADLAVTLSDSPDPVPLGQQVTYTAIVTNNGPLTATEVRFADFLIHGDLDVVSVTPSQGSCETSSVHCDLGTIANGASATVTLVATAAPSNFLPGTIDVQAAVSAHEPDPNLDNNYETETTLIQPAGADLAVTITDNPDPLIRGSAVTYVVTARNNGPAAASNVVMIDALPPIEVSDPDILVSQGSFTRQPRNRTITCNFGTLASGASATLTVTGFTATTGTITNRASATASEPDPNTANNSAAEDTTVTVSEEETLLARLLDQGQGSLACRRLANRSARFGGPLDIPGRPWLLSWLLCSQSN